ncbi:unnamed protein product, partial [Closterium sp. NIES-53]
MRTTHIAVLLTLICALLTPPALAADLVSSVIFKLDSRNKKEVISSGKASLRVYKNEDGTYTQTMSIDLNEVFTKGAAPYYRLFRGKPGTAGSQAFSGYQTVGWQRSKSPYNPLKPFMKGRHSLQHTASYDSITEAQYDAYVKPYMEQPSGYYLRRSSTGAQPAQRAPSHNEKRSGTPDAARAGGRYKRRKTLSDARATRGRSAEEPDDGERPARRASLRVAAGGKDGTRKAKRKEREEKPVSLILPPIPSSAGPLFQVRAGLTDFRARQLAMAVEAGVTSEVVWALNALQLISFSLKDTWQQGAGPLSKAPQLLSALVSVVASWRACSLEITDAATWRAMRGGPEGGGSVGSEPPRRGGGGSRSGGSGQLSRLLHDHLGERIR